MKIETRPYDLTKYITSEAIGLSDDEVFPVFNKILALSANKEKRSEEIKDVEEYIDTLSTRQVAAALHYFAEFMGYIDMANKMKMIAKEIDG